MKGLSPTRSERAQLNAMIFLMYIPVVLLLCGCFFVPGVFASLDGLSVFSGPWGQALWMVWLLPAVPVLLGLGWLQQRAVRRVVPEASTGWAVRTMIGGTFGLLAYLVVLWLLSALYYGGPLNAYWGIFVVAGDPVEVCVMLAGMGLAGALLGFIQWKRARADRNNWAQTLWWTGASAAGWTVAAIASGTLFKFYVVGYEPICFSCLLRLSASAGVAALVIGVGAALALASPKVSLVFSLLVDLLATALLPFSPTPVFAHRQVHPYRVLELNDAFVEAVAFSDDGQMLGGVKQGYSQGDIVNERVLLWRTSDWEMIGTIENGQNRAAFPNLDGQTATAETDTTRTQVIIKNSSNETLHKIEFAHNWNGAPKGSSFTGAAANDDTAFLTRASGEIVRFSAYPIITSVGNDFFLHDFSPDGKLIAGAYKYGGIWVWRVP